MNNVDGFVEEYSIEARGIFYSAGEYKILKDISFMVKRGEYFSIIGPNGSGKTTLLRCLDRIYSIEKGEVMIENIPLKSYTQKELARLIGYVPQATGAHYPFSVYEFVMMGRYPYFTPFSPPSKMDHEAVHNALEITRTERFAQRRISSLSGGERQKVFIATAIAQGATILLLDEPTTHLDPKRQDEIHEILVRLNSGNRGNRETTTRSGITIISVTHDLNHVLSCSHRILALKEGKVFFIGAPDEFIVNGIPDALYDTSFIALKHPVTGSYIVLS